MMKNKISPEILLKAEKVAKGTQKPGQTKEQTRLIAQGIAKGIAEYKKQQGKKARELDKQRKQVLKQRNHDESEIKLKEPSPRNINIFPWSLLMVSWLIFITYLVTKG